MSRQAAAAVFVLVALLGASWGAALTPSVPIDALEGEALRAAGRAPCPSSQNDVGLGTDAGDSLSSPSSMGTDVTWSNSRSGCVDSGDRNDYYQFSVSQGTGLTVSVSPSTGDFDVYLYRSSSQIDSSTGGGTSTDTVSTNGTGYSTGTFVVRVYRYSGDGTYAMGVWTHGISASTTDIGVVSATGTGNTAFRGGSYTVNYTLRNSGTTDPGAFQVDLRSSANTVISLADAWLHTDQWTGLAAGATVARSTTFTVPHNISVGNSWFGVLAESGFTISEANENNNTGLVGIVNVQRADPDWRPVFIEGPTHGFTGELATFDWQVANDGQAANATFAWIVMSSNPTITTSDTFVANVSIPALASGETVTGRSQVELPLHHSGTLYWGMVVDPYDLVVELDENDNGLRSNLTARLELAPLADVDLLSMDVVSTHTHLGGEVEFVYDLRNRGTLPSHPFSIDVFSDLSTSVSTADTWIGRVDIPSIAADDQLELPVTLQLPLNLSEGIRYFGAFVDLDEEVRSIDNAFLAQVSSSGVSVTDVARPDLVVSDVRFPAMAVEGSEVQVSFDVTNIGEAANPAMDLHLMASTNSVVSSGDEFVERVAGPLLQPGERTTVTRTVVLPAAVDEGTWWWGVLIDPEANETQSWWNNDVTANATPMQVIEDALPDLTAPGFVGPTRVHRDGQYQITVNISNIGFSGADPFEVEVYLSANAGISRGDTLVASQRVNGLSRGADRTLQLTATIPDDHPIGWQYWGVMVDPLVEVEEIDENNQIVNAGLVEIIAAPRPDLVPTLVEGAAFAVHASQRTVNFSLVNQGLLPANETVALIVLSTNTIASSGDIHVARVDVPALQAGETHDRQVVVTVPSNVSTGWWYWGVVLDVDETEVELDDANQGLVGDLAWASPAPVADLGVEIVNATGPWRQGDQVPIQVRVWNGGENASGPVPIAISLKANQWSIGAEVARLQLQSIQPGADIILDLQAVLAGGPSDGMYYVNAHIDPDDNVSEPDESDNQQWWPYLHWSTGPLAELVPADLVLVSQLELGQPLVVDWEVANMGDALADGVEFRLSLRAGPDSWDPTVFLESWFSTIPAQSTRSGQRQIALPDTLTTGNWTVVLAVDPLGNVTQIDASNDVTEDTFVLLPSLSADLAVAWFVAPATLRPGATVDLQWSVINHGLASSTAVRTGLHVSSNPVISPADAYLIGRVTPALAPGASHEVNTTLTVPQGWTNGSFHWGPFVDDRDELVEADERDNGLETAPSLMWGNPWADGCPGLQNDVGLGHDAADSVITASPVDAPDLWSGPRSACVDGDDLRDHYTFEVPALSAVDITVTTLGGLSTQLRLLDASGAELATAVGEQMSLSTRGLLTATARHTVTLQVLHTGGGGLYLIELQQADAGSFVELVPLDLSAPDNGTISEDIDVMFEFANLGTAESDEFGLAIQLRSATGDLVNLTDGTTRLTLAADQRHSVMATLTLPLDLTPGLWTLMATVDALDEVTEVDEANTLLTTIELLPAPVICRYFLDDAGTGGDAGSSVASAVDLGTDPHDEQPFNGCVDREDTVDTYRLERTGGTTLRIEFDLVGPVDATVAVTDLAGTVLDHLDDGDLVEFDGATAASLVIAVQWTSGLGNYTLQLSSALSDTADCSPANDGDSGRDAGSSRDTAVDLGRDPTAVIAGCLGGEDGLDVYAIDRSPGLGLDVTLRTADGLSIELAWIPDGSSAASVRTISGATTLNIPAGDGPGGLLQVGRLGGGGHYRLDLAVDTAVDLAATDLTGPLFAAVGRHVNLSWTVTNTGTTAVLGSTAHLSLTPAEPIAAAQHLAVISIPPLAAGDATSGNVTVLVPPDLQLGAWHWFFEVDPEGGLPEASEQNNQRELGPVQLVEPTDDLPDRDGDGVPDDTDAFPDEVTQWLDSDADGWGDRPQGVDGDDCPLASGGSWEDRRGCPDGDLDGYSDPDAGHTVAQGADGCPTLYGRSVSPTFGCPDTDGDGWGDDDDAFPFEDSQWSDRDGDGFGDEASGVRADRCPDEFAAESGDQLGCPPDSTSGSGDLLGENSGATMMIGGALLLVAVIIGALVVVLLLRGRNDGPKQPLWDQAAATEAAMWGSPGFGDGAATGVIDTMGTADLMAPSQPAQAQAPAPVQQAPMAPQPAAPQAPGAPAGMVYDPGAPGGYRQAGPGELPPGQGGWG